MTGRHPREDQKSTVLAALVMFALVLLILQLWLFVAAFENYLAGNGGVALPAALASVAIFLVETWMLAGVFRLDRKP